MNKNKKANKENEDSSNQEIIVPQATLEKYPYLKQTK